MDRRPDIAGIEYRQIVDGSDHLELDDGYRLVWSVDTKGNRHLWAVAPTEPGHFDDVGYGSYERATHDLEGPLPERYQRRARVAAARIRAKRSRCGDAGGVNKNGAPCRIPVDQGERCHFHEGTR